MDKVVFKENEKANTHRNSTAVRISLKKHRRIMEIAKKSNLSIFEVTERLIEYALENVEWEDAENQ